MQLLNNNNNNNNTTMSSLHGHFDNNMFFSTLNMPDYCVPDDSAYEGCLTVVDERRQRRMLSNRESARRSRMRKQKHIHELCNQLVLLRAENSNLVHKLNQVMESHDRAVRENSELKEETCGLRQMIVGDQLVNSDL